jgi:hypothetical protein
MTTGISTIAVATRSAILGTCALCARPSATLTVVVAITHAGGTIAQFDACDYCERTLRRIEATTPGLARFAGGAVVDVVAPAVPLLAHEVVGPSVPIQEFTHPIQDGTGALYLPVVVGAERGDGTWEGWIEFREIGGMRVLRTNRETTQPNQGALAYWASGLLPTYLEGAFQRARRPHTVTVP